MLRRSIQSFFFCILLACDPMSGAPDASACAWTPSGAPSVEVGTGSDSFVAFSDGDTLDLITGCQGSQHIFVGLRARGLLPCGTILDLAVIRDRDQMIVSQPFNVRVSLRPADGTDYAEVYGLTLQVPDPSQALGEALTLRARVLAMDGMRAESIRPIRIEWGVGGCRAIDGGADGGADSGL